VVATSNSVAVGVSFRRRFVRIRPAAVRSGWGSFGVGAVRSRGRRGLELTP